MNREESMQGGMMKKGEVEKFAGMKPRKMNK